VSQVHDVRATVGGTVSGVVVDEGQLIAEEDPIAVVDDAGTEVEVVTTVPGVVRELYVEVGQTVRAGDVVARIDES
jgi:biotin carboxyl carrier protein